MSSWDGNGFRNSYLSSNPELWSPESSDKGLENAVASFQLKPPE